VLQTAFWNTSIARVYFTCRRLLSDDFGEIQVEVGPDGRLEAGGTPVRAPYVVAARDAGVIGPLVAADRGGQLILVRPAGGVVRIARPARGRWTCPASTR
jgi:hypothetical protein